MNTAFDPSFLKVAVTRGQEEADELEAANIRKAVLFYLSHPPPLFDYSFLLDLHLAMFGEVWLWAGKTRRTEVSFGVSLSRVETALFDLTKRLPYWGGMTLVEQCARLHHELVVIHPFANGNGRWSRFVSDLWSIRHGGLPCEWPSAFSGATSPVRRDYIETLRAADRGDLKPLISLHERYASKP